jgi:UDP-glucuronate 4-epimerase
MGLNVFTLLENQVTKSKKHCLSANKKNWIFLMSNILITGTAGFIGFHLATLLLEKGHRVHGFDGITDYYDTSLKLQRHRILKQYDTFSCTEALLEDMDALTECANELKPDVIVHLAAQAGVRYSLENPRSYIDSNIVGTFNVMEVAREHQVAHLLMASTSSAYGANLDMPYNETQKSDHQLTIYAATKKANEVMSHSYSHLWNIPTTMFRFFTVYGPWGRPDMALFKFTKGILEGTPIDIYNNGEMYRDFTFVDDLVHAISLLVDTPPSRGTTDAKIAQWDSLSPVAPHRIINIGNSDKIRLLDFITAIEEALGKKAICNYMEMQAGDVPATWANADLLNQLTGYKPQTNFKDGVLKFVEWYRDYYSV